MRFRLLLICALAAAVAAAWSATAASAAAPEGPAAPKRPAAMSPAQRVKEFGSLLEQHKAFMGEKKYEEAVAVGTRMTAILPGEPLGHYNLACALARAGKADEAVASLARAVALGYANSAHMAEDEDLLALREDKRFAGLLEDAKLNERAGGAAYEKGEDIAGTKALEGFPEGGFRWRLRMSPDATKEKPNRLVVWLHPIGGSMNATVEPLAPRFLKHGFAVLVCTHKPWKPWTADDMPRVGKSIEDAGRVEGVDAARPILMGASVGGQMAFELWSKDAAAYGGLILNAAFPARVVSGVRMGPLPLPEGDLAKAVPIFALVGQKDGGVRVWQTTEPALRQAGVPLTLRYVPGKGHVWLFDDARLAELDKWLQEVAAGKVPADSPAPAPAKAPAKSPAAGKAPAEPAPAAPAATPKAP
jgi:dienelactone hydrolase